MITLGHIIAQIIVTTHTLEGISSNTLVMKLLSKLDIDAQKFADTTAAFETKWRNTKWFNLLQKGNKTLIGLFIGEVIACIGSGILATIAFIGTGILHRKISAANKELKTIKEELEHLEI